MKLILFSDLHITIGQETYGRMSLDCLEQAITHVREHHADADLCILMGDLTNHGQTDEYQALKDRLTALPFPCRPMMGNHDDRINYRRVFGNDGGEGPEFVQDQFDVGEFRCLLLDTLEPGGSEGSLSRGRLDWLSAALAAADRKCLIFLHHPPLNTLLPAFEAIGLKNREALTTVIAEHREATAALFFGHCHMSVSGTVAGVPAFGMRSLVSQMKPNLSDDRFLHAPELPPAYGVVMAANDDLAVHVFEFGYDGPPTVPGD